MNPEELCRANARNSIRGGLLSASFFAILLMPIHAQAWIGDTPNPRDKCLVAPGPAYCSCWAFTSKKEVFYGCMNWSGAFGCLPSDDCKPGNSIRISAPVASPSER